MDFKSIKILKRAFKYLQEFLRFLSPVLYYNNKITLFQNICSLPPSDKCIISSRLKVSNNGGNLCPRVWFSWILSIWNTLKKKKRKYHVDTWTYWSKRWYVPWIISDAGGESASKVCAHLAKEELSNSLRWTLLNNHQCVVLIVFNSSGAPTATEGKEVLDWKETCYISKILSWASSWEYSDSVSAQTNRHAIQ